MIYRRYDNQLVPALISVALLLILEVVYFAVSSQHFIYGLTETPDKGLPPPNRGIGHSFDYSMNCTLSTSICPRTSGFSFG
jgi:hypothetical protein